jgi:hypothetical protein
VFADVVSLLSKPNSDVSKSCRLDAQLEHALAACEVAEMPALSCAQSHDPITRAEVRADLISVDEAGYRPVLGRDNNYPANILGSGSESRVAGPQPLVE